MRHFLKETDFSPAEAAAVFELAARLKAGRDASEAHLARQSWGLLFYKSSTRTRVSFEVGVNELGGFPVVLNSQNTQIGRGETVADTAKVLSRYLHGLVIRTFGHEIIEEFAAHASMPVVNALTDLLHPCQIYADCFTLMERWSPSGAVPSPDSLKGRKIAFLGDTACNMANSWILGAGLFGMKIALAGPESFAPGEEIRALLLEEGLPQDFHFTTDPAEAVADADMVYTDVWVSMGVEDETVKRKKLMAPYSVTGELFAKAKADALFMHCLPAHVGEEVGQEVLDNPRSIIFDQAENRLHVQKAILAKLVELNR